LFEVSDTPNNSAPLPEFQHPPVVETALSVQFDPIRGMHASHFGLYWQHIRQQFPATEERDALEPAFELFGERAKRGQRIRFESRDSLRLGRVWYVNAKGTELIQLQADRFVKNWRKTGQADVYSRYEKTVKPGFERDLKTFTEFLASEDLGPMTINQCEVTYVDHIVAGEGWQTWSDAPRVFSFLGEFSQPIEDGMFTLRFPIIHREKPVGRLTVEVQPALRESDERLMYVVNLTARGMMGMPGMTGEGREFLDLGRAAIVQQFAALTTPAMHSIWGRTL